MCLMPMSGLEGQGRQAQLATHLDLLQVTSLRVRAAAADSVGVQCAKATSSRRCVGVDHRHVRAKQPSSASPEPSRVVFLGCR